MAICINGFNFSYDYTELLAELKDDIKEEFFSLDDIIVVEREEREEIKRRGVNYKPVVDYYFKNDNPPNGENFEKIKISDLIKEMEKLNAVI